MFAITVFTFTISCGRIGIMTDFEAKKKQFLFFLQISFRVDGFLTFVRFVIR